MDETKRNQQKALLPFIWNTGAGVGFQKHSQDCAAKAG